MFIDELFDILPSEITTKSVGEISDNITIHSIQEKELEDENKLLREKLLQAEEKIKYLEKENNRLCKS